MTDQGFTARYGPWALVAGASDGVGAAFAEELAQRGLNLVLLARRGGVLDEVAHGIRARTAVEVRTLSVDLTDAGAAPTIIELVRDLDIGFFVYCAGADPVYQPFLSQPIDAAEAMIHRNCVALMQLAHHVAGPMSERGRGGIVILGSGAGLVGAPNMAAYAGTKAFDLVFAEALWAELSPQGVDVLGLILGETDTPALRRLRHERGLAGTDEQVKSATPIRQVVDQALRQVGRGPTRSASRQMACGQRLISVLPRNAAVRLVTRMSARAMGSGTPGSVS